MAVLAALWSEEGQCFNAVAYILELCCNWGGGAPTGGERPPSDAPASD